MITGEQVVAHNPPVTETVDSVGAGDAFTAALVHHLLRGSSLEIAGRAANCLGAYVASQQGATPKLSDDLRAEVTNVGCNLK